VAGSVGPCPFAAPGEIGDQEDRAEGGGSTPRKVLPFDAGARICRLSGLLQR
jgi:hypothetical protein